MKNMSKKIRKIFVGAFISIFFCGILGATTVFAITLPNENTATGGPTTALGTSMTPAAEKISPEESAEAAKAEKEETTATKSIENFNVNKYLTVNNQQAQYLNEKDGTSSVTKIILRAIDLLIKLLGSVAMVIVIIGGLVLITAGSNEQSNDRAKEILQYGILGVVIALSAFIIITFINSFLSVATA